MILNLLNQISQPESAAWQMACDEVLLQSGLGPILRVYTWGEPAWTFGYFQHWKEVAETVRVGGTCIRRWTGGGMVNHTYDLPYSIILPLDHPWAKLPTIESYGKIHSAVCVALHQQGIAAELQVDVLMSGAQCFQSPVRADVMLNGKKIAGAAQRRSRLALLHQGSIQVLGHRLDGEMFLNHLAGSMEMQTRDVEISKGQQDEISALAASKYSTQAWRELR